MQTVIEVYCCVCHKKLGEKDGLGVSGPSHTYCKVCLERELVSQANAMRVKQC